MPTRRNMCLLWLLLLLHVCEGAFRVDLFKSTAQPREGDVRLVGSKSPAVGRVEVYHDSKWGTVCDDGWDMAEAQVVCRQLHFPGAKSFDIGQDYGQVTGPIWLDDIQCNGNEKHLFNCGFKGWGVTDCTHKEDVGVTCETEDTSLGDRRHLLDHTFSLSDDLGKTFDDQRGCNFLIVAKSASGNKMQNGTLEMLETQICAHKIMLSQFPLFNATEDISSITVDVSLSCRPYFSSFIRYLYTRKINVTLSSVQCIHWMASKFGVKQLVEDTTRLFTQVLPEDPLFHTQLSLYKYAEETGDLVLRENCIQYLAWNFVNLTTSPAWADISAELFGLILSRSDVVVPDEFFLLQSVESWITERGNATSLKSQVDLLNRIRFPMIAVEKLYALEVNSSLYSTHQKLYHDNMLKAFQFNVLLLSNLLSNPKFDNAEEDYQPRLYTDSWSIAVTPNHQIRTFSTPIHNSLIFQGKKAGWGLGIFTSQYQCSNQGLRCKSLPMVRLRPQSDYSRYKVIFHNRLLLMCQGKYICEVQGFKDDVGYISENSTVGLSYPCPDNNYTYRFVVRPEYILA
ncbi:galectin-3-binding protein [Solea senegalensis]|uniref:Galectin-3-binding protein n=1 Tax=Solea senegalensis TaxID=28829 RepID=A0AAV6RJN5_SOLSE|nr:galectin-3-binding protein A-like [Solea senegalensis]XP_043906800.1 galectin-3-binding protein A-like [Solea senegalensis]KAG7505706.1 galectin-3-binding protein [Solea senegalensis]